MRSSISTRWGRAAYGGLLAASVALSGCAAFQGAADTTVFTASCRNVIAGYYCVQPGDTLDSIAYGFGRKPDDIAHWNGLAPGATLQVAKLLRVAPPDWTALQRPTSGTASAPASPAQQAHAGQFIWPVSGVVVHEFGVDGSRGIEIAGRAGTPVRAAAAGRVVYAGSGIKSYGLMVIVKHDDGYVTAYGNNRKILVHEGDKVTQGMTIAEMGTRGGGQALLQFEMREGSHAVDPLAHLPAGSGPVAE
ncbi:lipoprotein NlpD [Paraburkholderia eburnea]|uniref:Lipoprotein NlpD n=1 Tax=Paraburkholderia eburnea TaxID=1189126 RepID=A0A2S4LVE0_9BURK|nr:peptidoglycan DD-metalloendopeptidase family protein [Paraburkholderia eburnea]POR46417.1 lipoprotein NlpD [Paraburkholderia eburnea]PRZ20776.1 lipoprotein NlpD [Paraburkholderia eburnea]